MTGNLEKISNIATSSDSPLLEFSFRNSWQVLDTSARQAMAVLSIFDDAPTIQEWRTALDWPVDKLDKAVESLKNMTFIYTSIDTKTGEVTYRALPITLTFSRNMLAGMGSLESECRARYQKHMEAMQLVAQESNRYQYIFETFVADSENEKKAIILCRMAESQEDLGTEAAEQYYQQALDLEPRSVYVLVKYGRFLVSLGRIGEGLELLLRATKRCNKRTGFFVYYNLALTYDSLRRKNDCVDALTKALEYNPDHVHARHLLGVTLSRVGEYEKAIAIFDELIEQEMARPTGPTNTLVYTLKTKVITIKKSHGIPEAENFLRESIELVSQFSRTKQLVSSLEGLWLDLS